MSELRAAPEWAPRFWSKVKLTLQCWDWIGPLDGSGYGQLSIRGHLYLAHRLSYELMTGQAIPDGLHVLHHCDNSRCVRPTHLFLGTNLDNVRDSVGKGRRYHPPLLTVCRSGRHEMTGYNLIKRRDGSRTCRACYNEYLRAFRRRRSEAGDPVGHGRRRVRV